MASSPIVNATLQAAFLSATSNVFAQLLQSYRSGAAFKLDTNPIFNFVVFTLLNTPPNFLWQQFLEDTFPGYNVSPVVVETKEGPTSSEKSQELVARKTLNKTNTAIKFLLDQTLGAYVNTVIFLSGMAYLKGADNSRIAATIQNDVWPLMLAGCKVWPMVSLLSFTVIPAQQRVVFGSLVGVAWGIFLSLFASH